jgi:probable rRNA maturation factor
METGKVHSVDMELDLQISDELTEPQIQHIPDEPTVHRWVAKSLALGGRYAPAHLTVRVVGEKEITQLNETYRQKSGTTNVLSFPFDAPAEVDIPLLGDIVICAPVVEREAREQHKTPQQHWAHMVVHGVLHLLGFDHVSDEQAQTMEHLEIKILSTLGFPDPYHNPREETEAL